MILGSGNAWLCGITKKLGSQASEGQGGEANIAHLDSHVNGAPTIFPVLDVGSFTPQNTMPWRMYCSSPFCR